MSQSFKSIYFSDFKRDTAQGRNLTLAFGDADNSLFEAVRPLSSHEIRERLGHHSHRLLADAAAQENLAVNSYCLKRLRQVIADTGNDRQQELFPKLGLNRGLQIDPLQATFRGGQSEPLHAWYPYLEGYSPGFVDHILQEFAPHAHVVLDPFGGCGTTSLTSAKLGLESFFCEVNPLLQFLVETKIKALVASNSKRQALAKRILELSDAIPGMVKIAKPDELLNESHRLTFSESRFFDDGAFLEILRARTVLDNLSGLEPDIAPFICVAMLASLVPASRLIRRGDVRFKTANELRQPTPNFLDATQSMLVLIANDLLLLESIREGETPRLVCEDARRLADLDSLRVDAVLTSPPYLNGTNYFRNTKIELWFLRCLRKASDLSDFRYRAVTAGINDVTIGKSNGQVPLEAQELVENLAKFAYDSRIPRMVGSYFVEMKAIFSAVKRHLTGDAVLALDIGDSAYGNVHVPTDTVLVRIMENLGFTLRREVPLRKRMSRGGFRLRQVLLVFDAHKMPGGKRPKEIPPKVPRWQAPWARFKRDLPHQRAEFAKRNWGHPLHSLCSYQGKMKPSLAHHLVSTFIPDGGRMLDPFGGVGTIPFEAALKGINTWTFDISPAALTITTAKLGRPDSVACNALQDRLQCFIESNELAPIDRESAGKISFNGALKTYFSPQTFTEILLARNYFQLNPPQNPSDCLVVSCLLHILHGNRPYALSRRSHPITPFAPTGPNEYRALLPRLREKVDRSLSVTYPPSFVPGRVVLQDATSWWPREVNDIDCVLTSPPFFCSTRFYLANWIRLWFCGWESKDFDSKPLSFVDERQKAGLQIYEPMLRQSKERLRPGGVVVMHLGKSVKCDMATELARVARHWFRTADIFEESVAHCESHGIRDKGTVTDHAYLVLQ